MFGNINLFAIFTTGFFTGGIACLAVQGGLLTATLAQREEEKLKNHAHHGNLLPITSFLFGKLIVYTLLGFFLGWLGSFIELSIKSQIVLQVMIIIFMLGTALNLLNVHPVFRYFIIQPPHFLMRFVRKQSERKDIFAPGLLGALTIFIPCGTTQAMMALAIASQQPLVGAVILFTFILGTSPLFFLLGYATMKLGDVLKERFMKVAALIIIVIAFFNLNNTIALTGMTLTPQKIVTSAVCIISYCSGQNIALLTPVTEQTVIIDSNGYTPNLFAVKAGSKITVHLVNRGGEGCTQAFTIPALNLRKIVPLSTSGTLSFVAPSKPGSISFMCSQGLYPGTIQVL